MSLADAQYRIIKEAIETYRFSDSETQNVWSPRWGRPTAAGASCRRQNLSLVDEPVGTGQSCRDRTGLRL
jgi:hypothetical protein